ncbi:hypothetical protein Tco_1171401 [Tanacetum coccineum]
MKGRGKGTQGTKATIIPNKATIASKKKRAKKIESSDEESEEQEERLIRRKPRGVKAIKANKHKSILQHQSGGSSEGTSITPEVPDDPTGKSAVSDEGANEKVEDILWVSTNEDESNDDDEEDDDESVDIEKTNDEKTDTDVEDHVIGVAEMNIVEEAEEENAKKVEKQNADEELRVDEEQQGDEQVRDKQVGVPVYSNSIDHTPTILESIKSEVPEAVNKYLGSTLGDTLQKDDVSKFIKVKQELAAKEKMPKYSTTPYDQAVKDEHKQKDILLAVDPASQRKRRHDDKDQDTPTGSHQGKKKGRTGKHIEPLKKSSKYKESAKVQMDVKDPNLDNVSNDVDEPQADAILKKDWFKKSPRPETLDPD